MNPKFFLLNLGCPKNLVDSEKVSLELMRMGFIPSSSPEDSDIVIVNTCGFIDAARKMTEQHIREIKQKTKGHLIAMGCYTKIVDKITIPCDFVAENVEETIQIARSFLPKKDIASPNFKKIKRINTLSKFSAYLKISEGCSRLCSFCSIPKIRGPIQSFDQRKILDEAKYLVDNGVRELIIISQDTTMWNIDKGGKREDLFRLLDELSEINDLEWIRLFYIYPDRFAIRLIDYIANNPKIVRYIEMPFQHIDDEILMKMARATRKKIIYEILENIKNKIPDMSIRTELIVGFPGETDDKFEELVNFVQIFKFDWLGVFEFSPEKNTPSYRMWKEQNISKKISHERKKEIMKVWTKILHEKQKEKIGKIFRCIYESDTTYRAYFQAPEIDGVIKLKNGHDANTINSQSPFRNIIIEDIEDENLIGSFVV